MSYQYSKKKKPGNSQEKKDGEPIEKHRDFDRNQLMGQRFAKENDPVTYLETKDPFDCWRNPVNDTILQIFDNGTAICLCIKYATKYNKYDKRDMNYFIEYNQSSREFDDKLKEASGYLFQAFKIDVDDDFWKDRYIQQFKKSKEDICAVYRIDSSAEDWKERIFKEHPVMRRFCKP